MINEDEISSFISPITDQKRNSQLVLVTRIERPLNHLHERSSSFERVRGEDTTKLIKFIPRSSIQLINIYQHPQHVDRSRRSTISLDRSRNDETSFDINLFNHKSYRRKHKSESNKKRSFNPLAYCMAYCTTIIIGTTIGGWIGGLFEFIFSGHNGCTNAYNGNFYCEIKYASGNISTSCVNIFYKKSIMDNAPYICLCRFRNQSNGKYRDCDFLHAKIR